MPLREFGGAGGVPVKVLVFGKTGQVARELARRCPAGVQATSLSRADASLLNPSSCAEAVRTHHADVVVNVAAYTAVDSAEADAHTAMQVNGYAPAAIAAACAQHGVPMVHVSTDYVFDGSGNTPFAPNHPEAPLNAYGRSKLAGERGVRASGAHHVIVRTSWVVSAHNTNFVTTMLRLGRERNTVRVVADQVGGPTPAAALADALFSVARAVQEGHAGGTYHFAGAPDVSWAEFAREIMTQAHLPCRVESITSHEYPTAAARPYNSKLDCRSFEQEFGVARPDWRKGLRDILRELGTAE